jgi:hypothetical protein
MKAADSVQRHLETRLVILLDEVLGTLTAAIAIKPRQRQIGRHGRRGPRLAPQ